MKQRDAERVDLLHDTIRDKISMYTEVLDSLQKSSITGISSMVPEIEQQNDVYSRYNIGQSNLQERVLMYLNQENDEDLSMYSSEIDEDSEETHYFDDFPIYSPITVAGPMQHSTLNLYSSNTKQKSDDLTPLLNQDYLEDEGQYVPEPPRIKKTNLQRLENRLINDDPQRKLFFDDEGHLKLDIPPVSKSSFSTTKGCPYCASKGESEKPVSFLPASIWTIDNTTVAADLRIEVLKIKFLNHPLSDPQNILTEQIRLLANALIHESKISRVKYYQFRISALRKELEQHPEKEKELLTQIIEANQMRDYAEKKNRSQRDALVNAWHQLQDLRSEDIILTDIELKWLKSKMTKEQAKIDEKKYQENMEKRAEEIYRYNQITFNDNGEDKKQILEKLLKQAKEDGLRQPGEPEWLPVLGTCQISDLERLNGKQRLRLQALATRTANISVNVGANAIYSAEEPIDTQFESWTDFGIEAKVMRVPESIKIHLYENGKEFAIANIPVVFGEPNSFSEFHFHSSGPVENGHIIEGIVYARSYVVAEKSARPANRYPKPGKKEKDEAHPDVEIDAARYLATNPNPDLNDPYFTAAINALGVTSEVMTPNKKIRLDPNSQALLFSAMAPTNLWKQVPVRTIQMISSNSKPQKQAQKHVSLQLCDVVRNNQPTSAKGFWNTLISKFTTRRPMQPDHEYYDPTSRIETFSQICISITQIYDLPTPIDSSKCSLSKPAFVVFFDQMTKPLQLNERIFMDLVEPGEEAPPYQAFLEKEIYVSIFDNQSTYIGCLHIPLAGLFANGKITGEIPIDLPPFLAGYKSVGQLTSRANVQVGISPAFAAPPYQETLPLSESPAIVERAKKLQKSTLKKFKYYEISALSFQSGDSLLPTRFVRPTMPPKVFADLNDIFAFVSLIPFQETQTHWQTTEQLISTGGGTPIEHAIAFCSFCLAMDKTSYVVLGRDIIYGNAAYVLTVEGTTRILWNPIDRRKWAVNDPRLSLFEVTMLFDNLNIWFNTTNSLFPAEMDWNLTNWTAFFNANLPNSNPILSTVEMEYQMFDVEIKQKIEQRAEETVKSILESIENDLYIDEKISSDMLFAIKERLQSTPANLLDFERAFHEMISKHGNYNIFVAPFMVPYVKGSTTEDSFEGTVESEILSRNFRHGSSFALAVYAAPFPNDFYAVWITIAELIPNDQEVVNREAIPSSLSASNEEPAVGKSAEPIEEEDSSSSSSSSSTSQTESQEEEEEKPEMSDEESTESSSISVDESSSV